MANKVEICGVDTAKLPLYKEAEMTEMLKQIKDGDTSIREKFINGNLRLVLSVIQRFSNRGENPDDLFQVGCIGLIKALDNFDLRHGVKFSTYAVPMIIGEVRRYLRDNNSIRVSRSLRDLAYKALQTKEALSRDLQKEPSVSEIAKELWLSSRFRNRCRCLNRYSTMTEMQYMLWTKYQTLKILIQNGLRIFRFRKQWTSLVQEKSIF